MPSFATIAAFATFAFATLGSALPHSAGLAAGTGSHNVKAGADVSARGLPVNALPVASVANLLKPVTGLVGGGGGVLKRDSDVEILNDLVHDIDIDVLNTKTHQHRAGGLDTGVVDKVTKTVTKAVNLPRAQATSYLDIIVALTVKVQAIVESIRAAVVVQAGATVDVKLLISLLGEIQVAITGALAEIKVLIEGNVEGVLLLQGQIVSIEVIAEIVASLVATVVVALGLVVKAVATVEASVQADVTVILNLVAQIGVSLAAIVQVAVQLASGILVHLVAALQVYVKIIVELKLTDLIQVLGITA